MRVAASGTQSTLKPLDLRSALISARAVVLPAQDPPVIQIRVMFDLSANELLNSIDCFRSNYSLLLRTSLEEEFWMEEYYCVS